MCDDMWESENLLIFKYPFLFLIVPVQSSFPLLFFEKLVRSVKLRIIEEDYTSVTTMGFVKGLKS